MKISIFIISILFGFNILSFGQNNYVFNGGHSSGFNSATVEVKSNNGIFSGSENDGFDKNYYSQITQKWNGGIEDGFSFAYQNIQNNNMILNGSIDDGMAFMTFAQDSNNKLYTGGDGDGFSYEYMNGVSNSLVFEGGDGDGFSASGISKLIWDGDLSTDWLMADNWNIPLVPTINHAVCIPNGVPHYPKLSGVLNISLKDDHTYTCSELNILPNALVKGIEGTRVVVNGRLIVLGDLFLNSKAYPLLEGRYNGHIEIGTGGSIRVEN